MKSNLPSELVSVGDFMKDLRESIFDRQFKGSEEESDGMEEFFSDDAPGKERPDNSEHGDLSGDDDEIEDGSDGGGGEGGGDGGGDTDYDDETDWDAYGDGPDNGYLTDEQKKAVAAANALLVQQALKSGDPGDLFAKPNPTQGPLAKPAPAKPPPDKAYAEKVSNDPIGVKADIAAAIKSANHKLDKVRGGEADNPSQPKDKPSQDAKNYTSSVQRNPPSAKQTNTPAGKTRSDTAVTAMLPDGTMFSGSVQEALETATEHQDRGADTEREAHSQEWVPEYDEEMNEIGGHLEDIYSPEAQSVMLESAAIDNQSADALVAAAMNVIDSYEEAESVLPEGDSDAPEDMGETNDGTTEEIEEG